MGKYAKTRDAYLRRWVIPRKGKGARWRAGRRVQRGHENVSFCTPRCFSQMHARSLFRMQGTTRFELATSAVTASVIWLCNNLQDRGDCQTSRKSYKT